MLETLQIILWPVIGYLFGSISSAILVSKLFRLNDPRKVGSGNPGATNVLRSGNKTAAAFTLIGDLVKGVVPVLLAKHFDMSNGVVALVAMASFIGHLYPIFFGFKGGKGVATAIGVFIALSWKLFCIFALTWLTVAAITRYSSLAALIAAMISALASFAIFNDPNQTQIIGAVIFIVAFLFKRHRPNVERLIAGKEVKIGQKSSSKKKQVK